MTDEHADGDKPEQCPNCGEDETRVTRQYAHSEPPEATVYYRCGSCDAKYRYVYRSTPELESVRT